MITDNGLKEVAALKNLEELYIGGNKITDEGLKQLVGLKQLKILNVHNTKVTSDGIMALQEALPQCEIQK
jgi:hypothetical protein